MFKIRIKRRKHSNNGKEIRQFIAQREYQRVNSNVLQKKMEMLINTMSVLRQQDVWRNNHGGYNFRKTQMVRLKLISFQLSIFVLRDNH
jgi:hypothetical protein